jgi:hypothetical protein
MSSKRLLPLFAAAALAATIVFPSLVDQPSASVAVTSSRIVDLAVITVRPTTMDAAYYRAHRIVDLPVVAVHPAAADQALFLAGIALQASLACRC